jgi:RND family efflux transporter MFP subunit
MIGSVPQIFATEDTGAQHDRQRAELDEFQLLQKLSQAASMADLTRDWIAALLPRMLALRGTELHFLTVIEFDADGNAVPYAQHPANRLAGQALLEALKNTHDSGQIIVSGKLPEAAQDQDQKLTSLVVPILVDGGAMGAVGIEVRLVDQDAMTQLLALVQLSAGWLQDRFRAESIARSGRSYNSAAAALHTVIAVAERRGYLEAAQAAVTDMAQRFRCDRASIGVHKRRQTRVQAISHAAQFSRNLRDVRDIQAVMDEAIDQESAMLWPQPNSEGGALSVAHEAMDRNVGGACIFTVPMFDGVAYVGAMVFERPKADPFQPAEVEMLEAVVTVISPILVEKQQNDRWLITKALEVVKNQARALVGPQHFLRKVVVGAAVLGLILMVAVQQTLTVAANASVEGSTQRVIAASFDGFIAAANAREGDLVTQGQVVIRLDDRDLVLERLRLTTVKHQEQLELDSAIATRDRSQAGIREARIQQADSQILLIDNQLERSQLRAPFDGLVISGDMSRSIGASVSRGEPLMSIAPIADFRIMLKVDERQISNVVPGQSAVLRLTALPDRAYALHIQSVLPIADYGEGRTTFRVVAGLDDPAPELRHGMQGAVRIEIEKRPMYAIWFKPVTDWLRMAIWTNWPV